MTNITKYRKAIAAGLAAGAASLTAFLATGKLDDWKAAVATAGTAAFAAIVTVLAPANAAPRP